MTRTLLMVVLAAVFAMAAPSVAGAAVLSGKMLTTCAPSRSAQDDPIVNPGVPGGADHLHDANGGTTWNAFSTGGSLLAGGTTCAIPGNHSAYWAPAGVAADGTIVHGKAVKFYYAGGGRDTRGIAGGRVQNFPIGFAMIAGNGKATAPQSTSILNFRCVTGDSNIGATVPTSCPAGSDVKATLTFPSCWDGQHLDTADHKSHVTYAVVTTFGDGTTGKACPPDHPVALPTIISEWAWPNKIVGGRFTSDHDPALKGGTTFHADVLSAWDQGVLAQVANCLGDPAMTNCGVVTTGSLAASLMRTGMDFRYVNSTGGVQP